MTASKRPAFSSPKLQAALDKASETLEGADEARNKVSDDIRALETYLIGLRLTTPYRHPLGKYLIPDNEQTVASSLEFGGCAPGKVAEDSLVLGEDGNGKVRLLYETCQWVGQVEVDVPGGPYFWDESTLERDVKPLIETKFEIRKKAYGRLPEFVIALAKHYAIDPWKLTEADDIPF